MTPPAPTPEQVIAAWWDHPEPVMHPDDVASAERVLALFRESLAAAPGRGREEALEEALRGAMKKLQRYGEQTEDESAALARPTTAHAPVGTNIVKCPCGRLHARSSGCPCGCATTPTPQGEQG